MKNFKRFEDGFVDYLNTLGLWKAELMSRINNGHAIMDAKWGPFSVEMKTEKKRAAKIDDWIAQNIRNREGLIPFVVHHQDYEREGSEIVIMKLSYFLDICDELHKYEVLKAKE